MSDFLQPHGLSQARLPCASPTPGACSKSCLLRQWCYPTILSSVVQFSFCLQSLYKINVIRLVQLNYGFTLLSFGIWYWKVAAKSLQSCPTLCDPIDGSPPGSTVPGFLQARTLEWVAISFSNAWKWKVKVKSLSRVRPLRPHGLQPTRLLRLWDFPGKSTGVGWLSCSILYFRRKVMGL